MRRLGIEGESGRARVRTTVVDRAASAASDQLARDFNPGSPDFAWCGDITYLRTGEGWLFLATVIDFFSRRVIGWSIATHMRTELVADALRMAVAARGGTMTGVIFHSDKGCQAGNTPRPSSPSSAQRRVSCSPPAPPECAGTMLWPNGSSRR
jgi:transposase InsO family protein